MLYFGITPEELYAHPELIDMNYETWFNVTEYLCKGGIEVNYRIRDEKQLAEVLKSGNYTLIME